MEFRDGFRVGFSYGTSVCKRAVGNMKSVKEHKEVAEAYIGGIASNFLRWKSGTGHTHQLTITHKSMNIIKRS